MDIDAIVREVLNAMQNKLIPVEASARHVHLSKEHIEYLFGHELTHKKDLSQTGQFACEERVRLIGKKGVIDNVAVLGPARPDTQVELSKTDCLALGVLAPLRESGDIGGSAPICISYGDRFVMLQQGVIVAKRHIHMTESDAKRLQVSDNQVVKVKIHSERPLIFDDVVIRVRQDFTLNMHIDFDEANACFYHKGTKAEIILGGVL